jgi:hypothetical protein
LPIEIIGRAGHIYMLLAAVLYDEFDGCVLLSGGKYIECVLDATRRHVDVVSGVARLAEQHDQSGYLLLLESRLSSRFPQDSDVFE